MPYKTNEIRRAKDREREARRSPESKELKRWKHRRIAHRFRAKQLGFVECSDFPPPPTDNKCAICHREGPLAIDHDHETGQFRGYICRECNMGLGKLGDTVEALQRVLAYLVRAYE
ncbi:endonuclease domain-containing protein [Bradyrhizobium sp. DASA03120]|uniref:endonuclease domain-containing protein n=1 Tax=Bradyrhizobium sp. SMVTL-02 TaxID=3395917 RepID=UPI003F72A9CF